MNSHSYFVKNRNKVVKIEISCEIGGRTYGSDRESLDSTFNIKHHENYNML